MSGQKPPRAGERGQGIIEYALIILFVSLAVVAALVLLGPTVANLFRSVLPSL